ncbi:MAG: MucB/RseB C-terminal domain-containing protein [Methylophilaceae bacterium]
MLRVFSGLVVLLASLTAHADDPWQLLEKTAYAARELNYEGQFIYQNGNQLRTVQITHMNNGGREFTRNMVLEDKPREVYSQGSDIVIFQPKNQKVMIEKRRGQNLFPAMLPTDMRLIKSSYTARLGATDYVAGRQAQIIELVPNDAYRYSYKIWADSEFGLLVKMTLLNNKNETLEQIYFNQLSMLTSQDLNWFQPKIDVSKSYVMEDATSVTRVTDDWIVAQLPSGYRKIEHVQRTVPGKLTLVNQVIFSDGIASVSLFIEPITKGKRPKMGHMLMGSTNICANVIDGHQIIVVGEVPAETVQQIAKAVSFKKHLSANK